MIIILVRKMKANQEKEEISTLLFYIEHNRIPELIKLMFSPKLSEELLVKYGEAPEAIARESEKEQVEDYMKFKYLDVLNPIVRLFKLKVPVRNTHAITSTPLSITSLSKRIWPTPYSHTKEYPSGIS